MAEKEKEQSFQSNVYQRLLKSRIVWLAGEVRDENANEIVSQLFMLSAEDPYQDITLVINSPGGSITAGSAIYDAMELIPNDVVTLGIGMAASMGQFLLTAGADGKRFATPTLRVLLHQPHGGFGGTAVDVKTQAELINDMKNQLASITARKTGQTLAQVHKDGDRDHWYTASQALEYGFVDHIVTNINDITNLKEKSTKK